MRVSNLTYTFLGLLVVALFVAPPTARAGDVVGSGVFAGASNHVTKGGVKVEKTANGHVIVLQRDFWFDGAPDPKVGFGNNGQYDDETTLRPLKRKSGKQSYAVPASIDVSKYNEVYIWCEKFAVPLGIARIK